jgi:hypothetical protein
MHDIFELVSWSGKKPVVHTLGFWKHFHLFKESVAKRQEMAALP